MFESSVLAEPLLYAVAAVGALYLVALVVLALVGSGRVADAEKPAREAGAADDVDDDGSNAAAGTPAAAPDRAGSAALVECPACGTANERGYRFCRACVGELPGADGRAAGSGALLRDSPL